MQREHNVTAALLFDLTQCMQQWRFYAMTGVNRRSLSLLATPTCDVDRQHPLPPGLFTNLILHGNI